MRAASAGLTPGRRSSSGSLARLMSTGSVGAGPLGLTRAALTRGSRSAARSGPRLRGGGSDGRRSLRRGLGTLDAIQALEALDEVRPGAARVIDREPGAGGSDQQQDGGGIWRGVRATCAHDRMAHVRF